MGFRGVAIEQGYSFPLLMSFRGFNVETGVYVLTSLDITDAIGGFKTDSEFTSLVINVEGNNYNITGTYTYGTIDLQEFNIILLTESSPVSISGERSAIFSNGQTYNEVFTDIPVTLTQLIV